MANKAFEIQESKLRIGGLDLEAGATAIAIPGLSQAATYFVEEVDERDGSNPSTFGSNASDVTVIDNSRYLALSGTTASSSYIAAEYSVDELDDGKIDEINVETAGVFLSADKTRAEAGNMWATTVANPFVSFNAGNWTQIPYRPKVRAGEITNIGGGGGADGASAYAVAVANGFVGDEAAWLASLVGTSGAPGVGVPVGGTTGQVLAKVNNTDYNTQWVNQTGGSGSTGDIEFSNGNMTGSDGDIRMQVQNLTQTGYYSLTPGVDYSTAVWDGTGITFNDPVQNVYDAIIALTSFSTIEVQISGNWFTVTSSGSSTPGMPQAPTLYVNEPAVGGPLNIDIAQLTIRQGTTSYVEISGSDFRVDVQDDIRIYGNDTFILVNKSTTDSIQIETSDGDHTWEFDANGNLTLPSGGDILNSTGTSVLFDGDYTNLTNKPTIPSDVSDLTDTTSLLGGGGGGATTNQITNTDGIGTYSVSVGTTGVVTMATARGGIEFGAMPEVGGPTHLHIMRPAGQNGSTDLFFGDDYNYVKLPGLYISNPESQQGVEIGSSLSEGTVHTWKFGADGKLTLPTAVFDGENSILPAIHFPIPETSGGYVGVTNAGIGITANNNTWMFEADGTTTFPNNTINQPASLLIKSGEDTAQVGSTMTIDTDSNAGTGAGTPGVVDVAYDNTIIPAYYYSGGGNPVFTDSTITFANGDVRTITSIVATGGYIEIAYDGTTTSSSPEFPIILKTGNYAAAVLAPQWTFGTTGNLTFPDATVQTTALVQREQIFTVDTGATDYAPTAVDFNLLFVTLAIGYSAVTPTSVTLPNGVPGQRLVIFNGSSLVTLTVNPGPLGRDISGGIVAEFIYSSIDGWMPLYGTNSPT